jgi:hypothetical protein
LDTALCATSPRPRRTTSLNTTPPRPSTQELGLEREQERDVSYLDNEREKKEIRRTEKGKRKKKGKNEEKKERIEKGEKEMNYL